MDVDSDHVICVEIEAGLRQTAVEAAAVEVRLRAELAELRNVVTPMEFVLQRIIEIAPQCFGDGAHTVGEIAADAARVLDRLDQYKAAWPLPKRGPAR